MDLSLEFVWMFIKSSSDDADYPLIYLNLYFSNASEQFESNSLINTSLSVYIDFATISRSFLVSALNSLFSVSLSMGSSASITISYYFSC